MVAPSRNRFKGNRVVTAQKRRVRDQRYRAGGYDVTWLKVPSELAWAVPPGQRFRVELREDGLLFAPEAA